MIRSRESAKAASSFFYSLQEGFSYQIGVSLGFGGMVGFCILGCDKQGKVTRDVVDENGYEIEMTTVYAPPLDLESLDGVPCESEAEGVGSGVNVLGPSSNEPVELIIGLDYGPLPPNNLVRIGHRKKSADTPSGKPDEAVPPVLDDEVLGLDAGKCAGLFLFEREVIALYGAPPPTH